ncbi:MAG: DUF58 domain-containing protein [Planctomycetes bacterium]|nr:DUF58 domain-containing protein [Planctomycetota bacterium]
MSFFRRVERSGEGWIEQLTTLDTRRFALAVRKLADGLAYGVDRSPFVGSGLEFAQARPYQEGDSIRAIDWRVTARTGKHFVREYETPKSVPCYLLIDTSASMTVASSETSKYELALHVAGGLAFAALDRASPVGVVGVGERAVRVGLSPSRDRVMQWLLELRRYRFDERTSLAARIAELAPSLAQRSLVVVLSDLHEPAAVGAIKRLGQRHDCLVLRFVDPAERTLRGAGLLRAREAETGREFVTHGRARWSDPTAWSADFRRAGIDELLIHVGEPFESRLRELLRNREWFGKGTR